MKMNIATIEVKTTDLTRNIIKQLDKFDTRGRTNAQLREQTKAHCRVSLPDNEIVIIEDGGEMKTINSIHWGNACNDVWGGVDKIPKVILLK